jgi:hypothetical protein
MGCSMRPPRSDEPWEGSVQMKWAESGSVCHQDQTTRTILPKGEVGLGNTTHLCCWQGEPGRLASKELAISRE